MSKPTSTVKDRWNSKAYDTITLRVKKGMKAEIKQAADERGYSLNAFVWQAILNMMKGDSK
jgi:uncharacterized protein (DUF1778 family)